VGIAREKEKKKINFLEFFYNLTPCM